MAKRTREELTTLIKSYRLNSQFNEEKIQDLLDDLKKEALLDYFELLVADNELTSEHISEVVYSTLKSGKLAENIGKSIGFFALFQCPLTFIGYFVVSYFDGFYGKIFVLIMVFDIPMIIGAFFYLTILYGNLIDAYEARNYSGIFKHLCYAFLFLGILLGAPIGITMFVLSLR